MPLWRHTWIIDAFVWWLSEGLKISEVAWPSPLFQKSFLGDKPGEGFTRKGCAHTGQATCPSEKPRPSMQNPCYLRQINGVSGAASPSSDDHWKDGLGSRTLLPHSVSCTYTVLTHLLFHDANECMFLFHPHLLLHTSDEFQLSESHFIKGNFYSSLDFLSTPRPTARQALYC